MKVSFVSMLKKWFFIGFLVLVPSLHPVFADNLTEINDYVDIFYFKESQNYNKNIQLKNNLFLEKLQSRGGNSLNNLSSNIRIKPSTDFRSTKVLDVLPIDWSISRPEEGWITDGNQINTSSFKKPLFINLKKPIYENKSIFLRDYNELWIDYTEQKEGSNCRIDTSIDFLGTPWINVANSNDGQLKWTTFSNEINLKKDVLSMNDKKPGWYKKDLSYSLSRLIGKNVDSDYRYTKLGASYLVQRRMDWPINENLSLLLNYSSLSKITSATVRVSLSKYGLSKLIQMPLPNSHLMPNGDFSIDLEIGNVIRSAFPKEFAESQSKGLVFEGYLREVYFNFNSVMEGEFIQSLSLTKLQVVNNNSFNKLKKVKSVNSFNSIWKRNNFNNNVNELLNKSLINAFKKPWLWKELSDSILVQKELNWMFEPNSKLAINVDPNSSIKSISLQFATKTEPAVVKTLNANEIVVSPMPNGKFVILIDLDSLVLDQQFKLINEEGKFTLHKVDISMEGSIQEVVEYKHIKAVSLFEKNMQKNKLKDSKLILKKTPYRLTSITENLNSQKKRRVFDLSEFIALAPDMLMEEGELKFYATEVNDKCSINIDSIQFVSIHKINKSNYLEPIEILQNKYSLYSDQKSDMINGVKFIAYSSPSEFHEANTIKINPEYSSIALKNNFVNIPSLPKEFSLSKNDEIYNIPINRDIKGDILLKDFAIQVELALLNIKNNIWSSSEGIELKSNGNIDSIVGSQIKGVGESISIFWPVESLNESSPESSTTNFNENHKFYLSITKGKDNIKLIDMEITNKDGAKWKKQIKANKLVSLSEVSKEIRSVELKLYFKDVNFEFLLDELSILSSNLMSYHEALNSQIPVEKSQLLKVEAVSIGIDNISIEHTPINHIESIERVGITLNVPNEWLENDSCILEANFIFPGDSINKLFCLNSNAVKNKFFTALELGFLKHKNLEKIEWKLKKPKGSKGLATLSTLIESKGISSMSKIIKDTPLFYLASSPYYLKEEDVINNFEEKEFWSTLPNSFLNQYLENPTNLTINKNPWVEIEKISISPKKQ